MLEYLIVVFEYYKTCKLSYLVWNFIISGLLATAVIFCPRNIDFDDLAQDLISNSIGILSLLVGFSLAMFTLLNTAANPNIDAIKQKVIDVRLYKKHISLFDMLLVSMIYIILIEGLLLIYNLLFPFFFSSVDLLGKIAFFIDVFLLIHIILINISTTVDFYFIITKKEE